MRKKMLFFVNPKAGQLELRSHLLEMLEVFTDSGYDVTVHTTQAPRDITHWIRDHAHEYDRIVCAGGDGTLNEAVSGLMQLERRPPLGYIPGGTVNDVASTLGISKHPVEAANTIVDGRPYAIDIGSFGDDRWFTYVAGFGAFTDVAYATPQQDKRILGRLAYLVNGAKSLGDIKPIPMRMEVNGQVIEDQILLGLVCSTTSVGGFHAKDVEGIALNDGLSEVVLVKYRPSLPDPDLIGSLLLQRRFDSKYFYTFQTDRVKFEFPAPVSWTLDGEFGGSVSAVTLRNHPRAVEILVPEPRPTTRPEAEEVSTFAPPM